MIYLSADARLGKSYFERAVRSATDNEQNVLSMSFAAARRGDRQHKCAGGSRALRCDIQAGKLWAGIRTESYRIGDEDSIGTPGNTFDAQLDIAIKSVERRQLDAVGGGLLPPHGLAGRGDLHGKVG